MTGQRVAVFLALLLLALAVAAYFDGGEEALHPIEKPVELPEGAQ